MDKTEKIEKLIEDHLIALYQNNIPAMRPHYLVTPENLVAFIDKYFTIKQNKNK